MENPEPPPIDPPIEAPPIYADPLVEDSPDYERVESPVGNPAADDRATVIDIRGLPLQRTPFGWTILIFVFVIIGLNTYLELTTPPSKKGRDAFTQQETEIRAEMYQRSFWLSQK